jgi:hypothetical protein
VASIKELSSETLWEIISSESITTGFRVLADKCLDGTINYDVILQDKGEIKGGLLSPFPPCTLYHLTTMTTFR